MKETETKQRDDGVQIQIRESNIASSPTNLLSSSSSAMPQLFPRPINLNSSQRQDILTAPTTSDSLLAPSFPSSLYSSSIPLFGHRYLSALNHAAAAASLGTHHTTVNPFFRNGPNNMAQLFANHASTTPTIHHGVLEKTLLKDRGECSSSRHSIDELSSQVFSQVGTFPI